jgi:nitroimidazol reductase NimA-like FMN-containing flavoprotein (pyridoxamine 5'-phosphate oxidase superfamily)
MRIRRKQMQSEEFIESRHEMEELLREEVIGYLGLCTDGEPYVVPLNYGYVEGRILFHGALAGKKLDYLRANPYVCFTVARQSGQVRRHGGGDPCHVDSDSVICYGQARVIDDPEERKAALNAFNGCFRPDAEEISQEDALKCGAVEIRITEMTGRREREHKRTYWRYTF